MDHRAKRSRANKPKKVRTAQNIDVSVGTAAIGIVPEPPETQYVKLSRRIDQLLREEGKYLAEYEKYRHRLDKMDQLDEKYSTQLTLVLHSASLLMQARENLRLVLGRGLAGEVRPEQE